MPKRKSIIPSYELKLCLPEDLFARLTLELWSDAEGRVPLGGYKAFFEARLREWFSRGRIDLAELVPGLPPGKHYAYGDAETLSLLRQAHAQETIAC